jgi:predicted NUDIX family NTP pyrophosphohydrolase
VAKASAGLLVWRLRQGRVEVLLVHPGGPFWARKDAHAWSIPKGEIDPGEDPLAAAHRETLEETGFTFPGEPVALALVRQPGGKLVHAFALEGDCDPDALQSDDFEMEWPPRSGRTARFPEVDRAAWFDLDTARARLLQGQTGLLDELARHLGR